MIIVDASVLANAYTDDGSVGEAARTELLGDIHWAGPEHLVVETFSAIRGRCLGGKISRERGADAVEALAASAIELVPTKLLLSRMWQLRDNLSGYDTAYVAVAEALDCPLSTADRRISRVKGLRCEIRLALPGDD